MARREKGGNVVAFPVPGELAELRSLPPDVRAEALVSMFRFVCSEFAVLVLEHVTTPTTRRKVKADLRRHLGLAAIGKVVPLKPKGRRR